MLLEWSSSGSCKDVQVETLILSESVQGFPGPPVISRCARWGHLVIVTGCWLLLVTVLPWLAQLRSRPTGFRLLLGQSGASAGSHSTCWRFGCGFWGSSELSSVLRSLSRVLIALHLFSVFSSLPRFCQGHRESLLCVRLCARCCRHNFS